MQPINRTNLTTDASVARAVREFLLEQGGPSTVLDLSETDGQSCRYRGPNGSMCGVGCLIADYEYTKEIEGVTSDAIISLTYLPENLREFITKHRRVLSRIQDVHDSYVFNEMEHGTSWADHINEGMDELEFDDLGNFRGHPY